MSRMYILPDGTIASQEEAMEYDDSDYTKSE